MIFKLNKKGLGLPTVLGIAAFVLAIGATLLTYAVAQANLVKMSFERTEAYANAVQAVDATAKIIVRDENLDPTYLSNLETYMGVTIETYSDTVYTISSMVTSSRNVTSYITGSASDADTYDLIFRNTGTETNFILDPMITPGSLISAYFPTYMTQNFPSISVNETFTDIQSVVTYVKTLAQANNGYQTYFASSLENQPNPTVGLHYYIDGNVEIPADKNLTITNDYLLVIDGDLTMNGNSTITGNVIVNGRFIFDDGRKTIQHIYATIYASDDVSIADGTSLGTISRPSFIFTEKDVTLGKSITGYGYFMSVNFASSQRSTTITGGVYATGKLALKNDVIPNNSLDPDLFYSYAIPSVVGAAEGSSGGVTSFKFTTPQLN